MIVNLQHQKGQSLIEFAISITVLTAFLVAIPMIAKIANVNIMSIQALDYAAWRVREGNTDNTVLTREVNDRYFGETALIVSNEKINNQGARLGTGKDGQQIYQNNTATIGYNPDNSHSDDWQALDNQYNFKMYDKKGAVTINVPLQNLNVIPEIPESMTIKKSLYVENQALTASDAQTIQQQMGAMNASVSPYKSTGQKQSNQLVNAAIDILEVGTLGLFKENKTKDISIEDNAVPKDRLEPYQP